MTVPASLFRQYCFCPRIVFYQYVLGLKVPSPLWVKQGLEYHQRETMLSQSRTLSRYKASEGKLQFDVVLKSEKMGIHGLADAVLFCQDQSYVVEFKLDCIKPTRGQILQLTAYASMVEEFFGVTVSKGFISYGTKGKVHQINFAPENYRQLKVALEHIQQMQNTQLMPDTSASYAQCEQCEYLNFCNDRG
ncbi:CRISPR-associated protein Cas4 [Vibrio sp. JC009]|uniref:CRISPR-associated protein Cas4 n=1 Tax=Vibrio sp. JC009 TaxID=2912314 RepID=UPI0023AF5503|nr:CRISPR-associated protein Cas4 [Vibrio sp. JC009]WED21078.1 CRISPR-associated protein Cas4 [Vibrio sp. JC009]